MNSNIMENISEPIILQKNRFFLKKIKQREVYNFYKFFVLQTINNKRF